MAGRRRARHRQDAPRPCTSRPEGARKHENPGPADRHRNEPQEVGGGPDAAGLLDHRKSPSPANPSIGLKRLLQQPPGLFCNPPHILQPNTIATPTTFSQPSPSSPSSPSSRDQLSPQPSRGDEKHRTGVLALVKGQYRFHNLRKPVSCRVSEAGHPVEGGINVDQAGEGRCQPTIALAMMRARSTAPHLRAKPLSLSGCVNVGSIL